MQVKSFQSDRRRRRRPWPDKSPSLNDDVDPNKAYFRYRYASSSADGSSSFSSSAVPQGARQRGDDHREKRPGVRCWIGRRYREAPNVIWSMYPEAKPAYVPVVRELAAGLAEATESATSLRSIPTRAHVPPDGPRGTVAFIQHAPTWTSDY